MATLGCFPCAVEDVKWNLPSQLSYPLTQSGHALAVYFTASEVLSFDTTCVDGYSQLQGVIYVKHGVDHGKRGIGYVKHRVDHGKRGVGYAILSIISGWSSTNLWSCDTLNYKGLAMWIIWLVMWYNNADNCF